MTLAYYSNWNEGVALLGDAAEAKAAPFVRPFLSPSSSSSSLLPSSLSATSPSTVE